MKTLKIKVTKKEIDPVKWGEEQIKIINDIGMQQMYKEFEQHLMWGKSTSTSPAPIYQWDTNLGNVTGLGVIDTSNDQFKWSVPTPCNTNNNEIKY